MQLHTLKPNKNRVSKMRVGRGGKRGKTSGRGHKGQKQHGGHGMRPEMREVIKRLPKLRGHGKNRARTVDGSKVKDSVVNLAQLENSFNDGEVVNPKTLLAHGLVRRAGGRTPVVKILANGELKKKLSFEGVKFSDTAKTALEKGGSKLI